MTPKASTLGRYRRGINKSLGGPATKDVGRLGELIPSLCSLNEINLNQTLDRVVVATPQVPGVTQDDVEDTIEYARLRLWLEYPVPSPIMLHRLNTAFTANGRGLY